jgi:hypothetical protein
MIRIVGLIAASIAAATVALADEAVTPPGSRIGLVPPPGFTVARSFSGFENRAANASILLVEFPAEAFERTRREASAEAFAKRGLQLVSTEKIAGAAYETMTFRAEQRIGDLLLDKWLMFFDAKILSGLVTVTIEKASPPRLPDSAVRAALASVIVRAEPNGDAIAALPFTVASPARFKFRMPIAGRGLLLKESPPPPEGSPDDAGITVALAAETSIDAADQKNFGEQQLAASRTLTVQSIASTTAVQVAGVGGFEYLAEGRLSKTGKPVRIILTALFPTGRAFLLLGLSPPNRFDDALPDFRAVIDSFRPRP